MHQPTVAVVILNWNGKKYLEQFLPSVLATGYSGLQVVVADNASTDDSVSFLLTHYPQIRLIQLEKNFGFAGGYNEALKQVTAAYYVLLNSDVEVTPGWLDAPVQLMESNPVIGACQPKIRAWHQRQLFEYAGGAGGWIDAYGYPFARGRVFEHCEVDEGQYDEAGPVFWATGAALIIRSQLFHALQGFDAFLFAHMEEIDLCWRLQLSGHQVYCCPQSVVYHVGGGTLPKGNNRKTFLNFRNNLIMLSKNLPAAEAWKLPVRMVLDGIAALKGLLSGDIGFFAAILKANLAFLRWRFGVGSRKRVGAPKPLRELQGVYPGLLIIDYFLRKRLTFSSIVRKKNQQKDEKVF